MVARGKHGPPKLRLDPVNTRKNERRAEALLARRRDAQGRCRPAPFFCARIPTLAKTRGQVFFLHVEMMLMEVLIVLDMKSSERRGSAAALRAEEARKFAFKTERGRESALDPSSDALLG
jgi:hypothetical protein